MRQALGRTGAGAVLVQVLVALSRLRLQDDGDWDSADIMCSDSLNISPRARWVVCPLGRTRRRGHGRRFIYPPGRRAGFADSENTT